MQRKLWQFSGVLQSWSQLQFSQSVFSMFKMVFQAHPFWQEIVLHSCLISSFSLPNSGNYFIFVFFWNSLLYNIESIIWHLLFCLSIIKKSGLRASVIWSVLAGKFHEIIFEIQRNNPSLSVIDRISHQSELTNFPVKNDKRKKRTGCNE